MFDDRSGCTLKTAVWEGIDTENSAADDGLWEYVPGRTERAHRQMETTGH